MKRTVLLFVIFIFGAGVVAAGPAGKCDKFNSAARKLKDKKACLELIDKAIECYRAEMKKEPSPRVIMGYADALDLKYAFLTGDTVAGDEKKQVFRSIIDEIGAYCASHKGCEDSPEVNYALSMMWGRYAENLSAWEAATEGVADKIKVYAERLYKIDPSFHNSIAIITLGRMHFMVPNIIFIITWPDKNKSKEYLEEFLKNQPDSLTGMLYLADVLWDTGEKEKASELYLKVAGSEPRDEPYFKDLLAVKEAKEKVKNLDIRK